MSYFTIEENKINEDNDMSQITHEEIKKHCPHNMPHTEASRKKISETQTKRYEMIRQLVRKGQQKQMTEERVNEIVDEAIDRYLRTHASLINNNNRPTNINL